MTASTNLLTTGQNLLKDVALRYAAGHGLHPGAEWEQSFDGWWLKLADAEHLVKVVFSEDEIIDFAEEGEGSKGSKVKIRNAFASLAM